MLDNLTNSRWFTAIIGIFIGLLISSPALLIAAPTIQIKYFPVIKAYHVANSVVRTKENICWDTRFEKLESHKPRLFDYKIEFKDFVYNTNAYKINPDGTRSYLNVAGFADHRIGEVWISHYCLDIPDSNPPIDGKGPVEIVGEAYYGSRFWVLRQSLPSFVVPGLTEGTRP